MVLGFTGLTHLARAMPYSTRTTVDTTSPLGPASAYSGPKLRCTDGTGARLRRVGRRDFPSARTTRHPFETDLPFPRTLSRQPHTCTRVTLFFWYAQTQGDSRNYLPHEAEAYVDGIDDRKLLGPALVQAVCGDFLPPVPYKLVVAFVV